MAKIIELILTSERRGLGQEEDDPVRLVSQLYTKEGALVAENVDEYSKTSFIDLKVIK